MGIVMKNGHSYGDDIPAFDTIRDRPDVADKDNIPVDIMSTLPGFRNEGENYSTAEQVIGTWVNGKPLYRRTYYDPIKSYTVTNTKIDEVMADISSWNIDEIVEIKGCCSWNTTDHITLPFTIDYGDVKICVDTPIFNGNANLRFRGIRNSGSSPCSDIKVTVLYTKTTDVAP